MKTISDQMESDTNQKLQPKHWPLKIYTQQKTKGKIMKMKNTIALALVVLGTSALVASAQDNNNDGPPAGGPPQGGQRGPGMGGQRPPPPLVIGALDANHDGVIDADEIANASTALKALDKNGDGKLTRDEFIGKRPQGKPPGGKDAGDGNNDGPKGPPPGDN